jgi:hypothetical protein
LFAAFLSREALVVGFELEPLLKTLSERKTVS